jgi:hypothetical protein
MAIKELQTRIALKYDSYSAWTTSPGKDLILLKGEIGICEIPADLAGITTAPTVLFKIGDGKSTFENLTWASALAADVFAWAKAEKVVLEENKLRFKTGNAVKYEVDLSTFATDAEVTAITSSLAARVSALESGNTGGSITNEQFNALDQRLVKLEGADTVEGSVANMLKVAKGYTDEKSTALLSHIGTEISAANNKVATLETNIAALEVSVSNNDKAIQAEAYTRKTADETILSMIGEGFSDTKTIAKAITSAASLGQQGITDAAAVQSALTTLTSTGIVAQNAANIAQVEVDLAALVTNFESNKTSVDKRLSGVEAFFTTAENETLDTALDTLIEIQSYLTKEGSATGGLLNRISEAENDIKALEATLATGGDFEKRVANLGTIVEANTANITNLIALTADDGAISIAIKNAQADATQGLTDAANAKSTADNAMQTALNAQNQVNTLGNLLTNVRATVEANTAAVSTLTPKVETLSADVADLQAIITTGNNTNIKLREDITALQTLTNDSVSGNSALRSDLNKVQVTLSEYAGSISDARAVADNALTRIEAIESDYLTSTDEFIFLCGTSTEITHTT